MKNEEMRLEAFRDRIHQPSDACWIWRGYVNKKGYGLFIHKGKRQFAHRSSYELHVGPIPDGLEIHHTCFNPRCVNPGHLVAMTHTENISESKSVGVVNKAKTHCPKGHPYDEENTVIVKTRSGGDGRECRICRNERSRIALAAKRGSVPRETYLANMRERTHCPQGHEFTEENTKINANGHRVCRTCSRDRAREAKRAKGAQPRAEAMSKTHCVNGHAYTPENTYEFQRNGRTYRYCRECSRAAKRRQAARG